MNSSIPEPVHGLDRDTIEEARIDMAAVFRIAARENLHEGIDNHFSHALPDGTYLINRWGVHWSRMRRRDVLRIDAEGSVLNGKGSVEKTAFFIHGAVHRNCPHAATVLHTHMPYATAVACTEGGLDETLSQAALFFHGKVSYEDYGGFANDRNEGDRMAARIGDCTTTFLRNHGVMVMGPTPGCAMHDLYFLERACQLQILAHSSGQPLVKMSPETASLAARQADSIDADKETFFVAMKELLADEEPDYRD